MNIEQTILTDILTIVEAVGSHSIDLSILLNGLFRFSPTITSESHLRQWAQENDLQYNVQIIATQGQPETNIVHFSRLYSQA